MSLIVDIFEQLAVCEGVRQTLISLSKQQRITGTATATAEATRVARVAGLSVLAVSLSSAFSEHPLPRLLPQRRLLFLRLSHILNPQLSGNQTSSLSLAHAHPFCHPLELCAAPWTGPQQTPSRAAQRAAVQAADC